MSKFSFHHKWNKASLLVINWYIRVASPVDAWLKTDPFPYLVHYFTWKLQFVSNHLWRSFNLKSQQSICTKRSKICLTWQLFYRSFQWCPTLALKAFQVWSKTSFQKYKINSSQNIFIYRFFIYRYLTIQSANKDVKSKRNFADNHVHKFWEFLMVEQIFHSPKVEQIVVFSNKLVYQEISGITNYKSGNIRKTLELHRIIPPEMKTLSALVKIS